MTDVNSQLEQLRSVQTSNQDDIGDGLELI